MQKISGKLVNTLASWVVYGQTYPNSPLYSRLFHTISANQISISGFCQGILTQDRYTNFIGYSLGVYQNNTLRYYWEYYIVTRLLVGLGALYGNTLILLAVIL